ncbi:hypothetical protein K438DRAFT_1823146, partial [Mycena galopus ATCC 62051]
EAKGRGGIPWATLTVEGDPRLTKVTSTIMQGSNLIRSVRLALRNPETIQAVCILIKGEILEGRTATAPIVFLNSKHTLWSAAEGDPQASENSAGKSNLKLQGDYHWPFTVPIPTTMTKNGETFRLPHTFLDRLASFSVRYSAELRLVRGKLRPDDKVTCGFGYFSMQQPGPPSMLRQLAYQENSPLFGPAADSEGWFSQSASLRGMVFSCRMVKINFTFSLAKPVSYTRSASIPCALTIETNDRQALDLLSAPSASMVYLERAFYEGTEVFRNIVEPCGQAVFWPSPEGAPEESTHRRHLIGKIHLKANLQPSSAVFGFQVEYAVVVFPFQAATFKPLADNSPLLRQIVEITTRYAPGPRPKTYSPPTYETQNSIIDYYYYALVIENAQKAGKMRVGRTRGGRG